MGSGGFGTSIAAAATGQWWALPGTLVYDSARKARKEQDALTKKLTDRQNSLLKQQEQAAAEEAKNERLTRERRQAQAAKRLAIGLTQGKTGTVKTSALGLQNSGNLASNKLGVA